MIAIIAILASILKPALNKAREKAKAITCSNNLKQAYMSISFYADDNNDFQNLFCTTDHIWLGKMFSRLTTMVGAGLVTSRHCYLPWKCSMCPEFKNAAPSEISNSAYAHFYKQAAPAYFGQYLRNSAGETYAEGAGTYNDVAISFKQEL